MCVLHGMAVQPASTVPRLFRIVLVGYTSVSAENDSIHS